MSYLHRLTEEFPAVPGNARSEQEVDQHMAGKHSREHAGENTESKRHGKSAHGAAPKVEQEHGAYEHGQVGVKHSAKCPGEASPNCTLDGFLHPKFFTNALKDDTVGIHCHANGQDCATDGGQRECCM